MSKSHQSHVPRVITRCVPFNIIKLPSPFNRIVKQRKWKISSCFIQTDTIQNWMQTLLQMTRKFNCFSAEHIKREFFAGFRGIAL